MPDLLVCHDLIALLAEPAKERPSLPRSKIQRNRSRELAGRPLTASEVRALTLAASGYPLHVIAALMLTTKPSVMSALREARMKLGVRAGVCSTTATVAQAIRLGLIEPPVRAA